MEEWFRRPRVGRCSDDETEDRRALKEILISPTLWSRRVEMSYDRYREFLRAMQDDELEAECLKLRKQVDASEGRAKEAWTKMKELAHTEKLRRA